MSKNNNKVIKATRAKKATAEAAKVINNHTRSINTKDVFDMHPYERSTPVGERSMISQGNFSKPINESFLPSWYAPSAKDLNQSLGEFDGDFISPSQGSFGEIVNELVALGLVGADQSNEYLGRKIELCDEQRVSYKSVTVGDNFVSGGNSEC